MQNSIKKKTVTKWLIVGLIIGSLNALIGTKYLADRLIGASTGYPYIVGEALGLQQTPYLRIIAIAGSWEFVFVIGCLFGALCISFLRKDFRSCVLHSDWVKIHGKSVKKRMIYSFIGGFILIFGARMADGCSSGHVLSGGMQLAFSGILFGICAF